MYQKIILVGNLGRDPEMRYAPTGQAVTNFSLATNRSYTASRGERVKETVWFRVSAWGRQAETCAEYLGKGSRVLVEGRLTADPATGGPRVWQRQDGSSAASFEVSAVSVQFLSGRADEEDFGSPDGEPAAAGQFSDEDIPF